MVLPPSLFDQALERPVLGTDEDVASYLRIKPPTLRQWRARKAGPPYLKFGKVVRYDMAEVERWARDHVVVAQVAS